MAEPMSVVIQKSSMLRGATLLPGLEQAASHMPFDQFGRYHMLREAVDACRTQLGKECLTILDVGGFFDDNGIPTLPLMQFLPNDDVSVVDVVDCDLSGYIKGDGTALTFEDASFDLVVSADTLEHIPRPQRPQFWTELLRVARHGVLLLAPFGTPEVELAEAVLAEFIRAELAVEQPQLREHREYRLPVLHEWLDFLENQHIGASAYPTGYLHAWLSMMVLKHMLMRMDPGIHAQHLVDGYYNRCFFPTERRNPAYRHLIVAEKTAGLVEAVDVVIAPTILPDVEDPSAHWGAALVPTLITVVQHQLGMLREQQAQVDAAHAQAEVVALQQQMSLQVEGHETLLAEQREQVRHYRQQISMFERILVDQQIVINRLNEQLAHGQVQLQTQQQITHYEATLRDLSERAAWFEQQALASRNELEAVKRGRVLRLLNKISKRKNS